MWLRFAAIALAAAIVPSGAFAQPAGPANGAPSDWRAQMEAVRADAKASAFGALSSDHKAKVQAIVDAFDADGATIAIADATKQIDAVLTPQEATAVLAAQQKMRDQMRAAMAANGDSGEHHGGRGFGGRHAPDAGRFLLQVDAMPDRYRAAMEAERGNS
jgi:Skp family chaperone for outer membrane proteins